MGHPGFWAVGDCAQIPDWYNAGKPCPPTAQHALREGAVVAENVVAALRGTPPRPFKFRPIDHGDEGVGTQGLRALGRGVVAGLVGGALFTVVMVQIGFLTAVAWLIGSYSPLTGLVVHLVISFLIGASYGVLFRRQSHDLGSALRWGVSYGFFWWILGPLTLMPILLGATPQWTVAIAAGLFASLIGHLAYGGGLGLRPRRRKCATSSPPGRFTSKRRPCAHRRRTPAIGFALG